MSTTRLISTNTSAMNSRYAAITGTSTTCTDVMNSDPTPGHWNTVSVTMANAMTEPSCKPVMVMTGTSVFFSAWPKLIARRVRPRARAKRMYSVRRTSSISARTRRMISVSWNSDRVIAGRISDLSPLSVRSPVRHQPMSTTSPRPKDGSHPSSTAKT